MNPEEQERIKAFMEEYGKLVEKHGVDFANYPVWVPGEGGRFECIIQSAPIDIRSRPVPSPFVA